MNPIPPSTAQDGERPGGLAMKFRGTRREEERRDIARDYSQTVERLIDSGSWHEMPASEDQLPDEMADEHTGMSDGHPFTSKLRSEFHSPVTTSSVAG
jgi:hypothetical protein